MRETIFGLVASYGYVVLFVLVGLESLGIPLPGETALVTAAALAALGHLSICAVMATAIAAAVIGDNGGYWIGRKGGIALMRRYGRLIHLNESHLDRSMRILIIEDDPELQRILRDGFGDQLIESVVAGTLAEGREHAVFGSHDAIVLDVLLPGGNGFDLCAELRAHEITTPILILTARDAVEDRVRGLEVGADDYLTKPFAFRELLARVRALTRRAPVITPDVYRCANLEVDLSRRTVRRDNRSISLTAKEFALLEFFVRNEGNVVNRTAITGYVWDENHDPSSNVLDVLVRRLRRKIDVGYEPNLIHTFRGAGYRFGVEPAS